MSRLGQAVAEAATRRVVWEAAKAAGDADVFMRAQAHRAAEAEVTQAAEAAIVQYAEHLRTSVPQGAEQAVIPPG